MTKLSEFCPCTNTACPLHPSKHDKGCAPCINKNLKLKEIPNCFFGLVRGSESRGGDSFKDFAQVIIEESEEGNTAKE